MTTRLRLLSTGGTITSTPPADGTGGVVPSLGADDLLGAAATGPVEVTTRTLRTVASSDLTWPDLAAVRAAVAEAFGEEQDAVVVVQGTDTIEETSFALDLWHAGPQPVVVTGAMRHPGSAGADGPGNVAAAVTVACAAAAHDLGVLVAFADEIHAARWVRKTHTSRPAAFASPTTGPLGWVVEGRVRVAGAVPRLPTIDPPGGGSVPPVALLPVPLGDDGRLLAAVADAGYAGLVVEGMGGGHVPSAAVDALTRLASRIPVVLATRCLGGEGLTGTYGFPGSESDLLARGLISGGALSPVKARVLLSVALAGHDDPDAARDRFRRVRDQMTR